MSPTSPTSPTNLTNQEASGFQVGMRVVGLSVCHAETSTMKEWTTNSEREKCLNLLPPGRFRTNSEHKRGNETVPRHPHPHLLLLARWHRESRSQPQRTSEDVARPAGQSHRTAACDDKALRATGGQPQKTRKTARTSRGTLTASCPSSRARSARSGHPPVVLRPGGLAGGARRRSAHGARPCNDRRVARSSGMQAQAHAHAGHPSTVPPRRAPDHGTARADAPGEGHAGFHAVRR